MSIINAEKDPPFGRFDIFQTSPKPDRAFGLSFSL